ncbi:P-loop containing nucleoside triphosphate hydrolase protein [Gigaspora rosea]|uniref:Kinesin-like protein n=1 Tax=Gigaspora rosea TaxID=44941 RepID=A0A397VTV9_9GLOM|nr:P-loop containing nucleoside triphosphate hydrolase protein [Gigaspora rosea]
MSSNGTSTSVQVALRIKPLTQDDLTNLPARFQRQIISVSPYNQNQVVVEQEKRQIFQFDHVFSPETTQQEVYERAIENMITKFLEGYNVTILAYGQTSSGKTHTMGTADDRSIPPESKGIIPRTMAALFSLVTSGQYKSHKFSIKVSFIEIHNEDLIDLLGEGNEEERPPVMIREDSRGNIYWTGLQELKVTNVDEVMDHLARGSMNRQVGVTDMNSKSSRSHAIFSVTMVQQKFIPHNYIPGGQHVTSPPSSRPGTPASSRFGSQPSSRTNSSLDKFDDGEWVTISSKFHFVDLAGSERLKRTAASGDRAREGISINSGLLALGNVISALGDPNKARHTTHVPYRDSKLTRLLQDSLGGNAQTLMIACVSPIEYNVNETISTLKYANRARNIKNLASVNQEEAGWNDVTHLQNLVMKLRSEISTLKAAAAQNTLRSQNGGSLSPEKVSQSPIINGNNKHSLNGYSEKNNRISGGMNTQNNDFIGKNTSITSGIPGRMTPTTTSGIPGKSTPVGGRETPTRMRPTSPLNTFTNGNIHQPREKLSYEALEEQLLQLQISYQELTQKHAKTSAELALHQDNYDEMDEIIKNNDPGIKLKVVTEQEIEQFEKTISSLESKLAITSAALTHSESMLKEQENRIEGADSANEQNKDLVASLQKYIKELETKLQQREIDLRITSTRDTSSEKFISETIQLLETRLKEKDEAYAELEEKLNNLQLGESSESSSSDKITRLEAKLEFLSNEVNKLRNLGIKFGPDDRPEN